MLHERNRMGQTDGQTHQYTRFAWAGGTFFPVVLLCWFWRETGFGFTYLRTLLKKKIGTNIFLIVVEVLRFFVRQFRYFRTNFLVESEFSFPT